MHPDDRETIRVLSEKRQEEMIQRITHRLIEDRKRTHPDSPHPSGIETPRGRQTLRGLPSPGSALTLYSFHIS